MNSSASLSRSVIIFGATGTIGKHLVQALITAKSSFAAIGIFTSPATLEKKAGEVERLKASGVLVVVGDVNSENDVRKALEGFDTVVSALGRAAIASQIPLLKIAEASPSIKAFYPSEYGTDIEYWPESAAEKPHQFKLQVRKFIREQTQKLAVTYLVTGPYPEFYITKAPKGTPAEKTGGFDAKGKRAVLLGDGKQPVSFTTMGDVGKLLVAALKKPSSVQERLLQVNSFTATPEDILKEFEKQTGPGWDVEYTSLNELKALEKQAYDSENPMATGFTLKRIWTQGGTIHEKRSNAEIGEPKTETLEEIVKTAIQGGSANL